MPEQYPRRFVSLSCSGTREGSLETAPARQGLTAYWRPPALRQQPEGAMDLPPPGAMRWTAWQKVAVIRAVRNGLITASEVRARYLLSEEELATWQTDFDRSGLSGLQQKSLRQRRRGNRRRRHRQPTNQ